MKCGMSLATSVDFAGGFFENQVVKLDTAHPAVQTHLMYDVWRCDANMMWCYVEVMRWAM